MEKVYKYDPLRYIFGVTIPALLAAGLAIYSAFRLSMGGSQFNAFVLITCALIATDHLCALTRPKEIRCTEKGLELSSFGRKHAYVWNKIECINLRKGAFSNKIYLRLGDTSFFRGRYWINVDMYNEGDMLIEFLKKKEAKLHPMLKNFSKRSTKVVKRR